VDNCLFCKIIAGDIPSSKVYEDEDVLAFLDIMPISKGHTLVIPKAHSANLAQTQSEIMEKLGPALKTVSKAVADATGADGVNLVLANGEAAGQEVEHLHFHIIPRHGGDGIRFDTNRGKYNDGEMDEFRKKIADAF
jgi:histidine triad (HIT) family protein